MDAISSADFVVMSMHTKRRPLNISAIIRGGGVRPDRTKLTKVAVCLVGTVSIDKTPSNHTVNNYYHIKS